MSNVILGIYLIIVGLRLLFDLNIPLWVDGILALIAGIMCIATRWVPRLR